VVVVVVVVVAKDVITRRSLRAAFTALSTITTTFLSAPLIDKDHAYVCVAVTEAVEVMM